MKQKNLRKRFVEQEDEKGDLHLQSFYETEILFTFFFDLYLLLSSSKQSPAASMNTIVLKDTGQTLYYHKQKADIQNVLGKVSATLTEYVIYTGKDDIICRLYKTKEGSWYDPLESKDRINNKTKQEIKSAIDASEIEK